MWIFDILGVVKFIETVAGNEVNADTIDRKMFDEIQNCLENIIKKIEATNPKAAISDEPFTLWEVISGLMNLEKINLDESLQVSSRASADRLYSRHLLVQFNGELSTPSLDGNRFSGPQ